MMLFYENGVGGGDVNIFFWYSLGQYKDYMSDGHTAVSSDCRVFKAKSARHQHGSWIKLPE